eukprot:TRINITY_DN17517_c0_g3_i1.p1 TRINITY_DN17517_c0_g3~~TRINITY_DN17517_c0_g3_i1.p1  ORF type:complete len:895 (+),score=136.46 TRINITY_DN17517_c0_g3_i1:146-2830(+)
MVQAHLVGREEVDGSERDERKIKQAGSAMRTDQNSLDGVANLAVFSWQPDKTPKEPDITPEENMRSKRLQAAFDLVAGSPVTIDLDVRAKWFLRVLNAAEPEVCARQLLRVSEELVSQGYLAKVEDPKKDSDAEDLFTKEYLLAQIAVTQGVQVELRIQNVSLAMSPRSGRWRWQSIDHAEAEECQETSGNESEDIERLPDDHPAQQPCVPAEQEAEQPFDSTPPDSDVDSRLTKPAAAKCSLGVDDDVNVDRPLQDAVSELLSATVGQPAYDALVAAKGATSSAEADERKAEEGDGPQQAYETASRGRKKKAKAGSARKDETAPEAPPVNLAPLVRLTVQALCEQQMQPRWRVVRWCIEMLVGEGVPMSQLLDLRVLDQAEVRIHTMSAYPVLLPSEGAMPKFPSDHGLTWDDLLPDVVVRQELFSLLATGGWLEAEYGAWKADRKDHVEDRTFIAAWLRAQASSELRLALSFGHVFTAVCLALSDAPENCRPLLGKRDGRIVPYAQSMDCERRDNAAAMRPTAVLPGEQYVASWVDLRICLQKLQGIYHGDGVPVSHLKERFREQFGAELSETAFGHERLRDLLEDAQLKGFTYEAKDEGVCQLRFCGPVLELDIKPRFEIYRPGKRLCLDEVLQDDWTPASQCHDEGAAGEFEGDTTRSEDACPSAHRSGWQHIEEADSSSGSASNAVGEWLETDSEDSPPSAHAVARSPPDDVASDSSEGPDEEESALISAETDRQRDSSRCTPTEARRGSRLVGPLEQLIGQWRDENKSFYEVTKSANRNAESLDVRTVRPNGQVIVSKSLLQLRGRWIVWGRNGAMSFYVVEEAQDGDEMNHIVWAPWATQCKRSFVWTRVKQSDTLRQEWTQSSSRKEWTPMRKSTEPSAALLGRWM